VNHKWKIAAALLFILAIASGGHAEAQITKILYVYVTACESCAKAAEFIDALPASVEVQHEAGPFVSEIVVERLNLADNVPYVESLFAACAVPEKNRIAPSVFIGGDCLVGAEAIEANLLNYVREGRGIVHMPETADGGARSIGFVGAALAGVIGGLNPCALSMLLLFLTNILSMHTNPGRHAAVFLASKFVCYILVGTVLFGAFRAWNPEWLAVAARILMTAMALALAVVNLMDARRAHLQKYGQIRNQLPTGMRRFLHRLIEGLPSRGARCLLWGTLIVGIVVALSEFLCAGQVYLAVILAALQSRANPGYWMLILLIYCVAFLLPSGALAVAIIKGQSVFQASSWFRERMAMIKVLSALAVLAVAFISWLIAP
jgi:hypothetical protein